MRRQCNKSRYRIQENTSSYYEESLLRKVSYIVVHVGLLLFMLDIISYVNMVVLYIIGFCKRGYCIIVVNCIEHCS